MGAFLVVLTLRFAVFFRFDPRGTGLPSFTVGLFWGHRPVRRYPVGNLGLHSAGPFDVLFYLSKPGLRTCGPLELYPCGQLRPRCLFSGVFSGFPSAPRFWWLAVLCKSLWFSLFVGGVLFVLDSIRVTVLKWT